MEPYDHLPDRIVLPQFQRSIHTSDEAFEIERKRRGAHQARAMKTPTKVVQTNGSFERHSFPCKKCGNKVTFTAMTTEHICGSIRCELCGFRTWVRAWDEDDDFQLTNDMLRAARGF